MEKIISFGHLNIDAADELYIGGKRQKAEIFSIGDSQNNDTDIRWQIQNGKLIQKDPVVQAYWYSLIQSNFHSGILVAVDGFEFSAHIPCIQTSDLADCRTLTAPTPYGVGFLEKDATRPSLILPVRGWWCHRGGSCSPLAGRRTLRRMHACCATSRRKLYAPKHPLFSCGRWLPIFMRLMHSP